MRFLKKVKTETTTKSRNDQTKRVDALLLAAKESREELNSVALHTKEIAEDITLKLRNDLIDKMRQLELTANIIADAMMVCAESGEILFMNHIAENIVQQSLLDNNKIYIQDYVKTKLPDYWDVLMANPDIAQVVRGDGAKVMCSLNIARLEKNDGETQYIVLLHHTQVLEDIETRAILNKGTLLVCDGIVVSANEEVKNVLGYDHGELEGKMLNSLVAGPERPFVNQQIVAHEMETTFDTVLLTKNNKQMYCKMAIAFVVLYGKTSAIVTLENIGEDVVDRKVDVLRCFGEDFFFRSSTFLSEKEDMIMFLTTDLIIKYVNEPMRARLVCDDRSLIGVRLEDVLTATEYKIALLHFQGLTVNDRERTITMHLKNTNAGSYQEWTDRAFFNDNGNVVEYRRMGNLS